MKRNLRVWKQSPWQKRCHPQAWGDFGIEVRKASVLVVIFVWGTVRELRSVIYLVGKVGKTRSSVNWKSSCIERGKIQHESKFQAKRGSSRRGEECPVQGIEKLPLWKSPLLSYMIQREREKPMNKGPRKTIFTRPVPACFSFAMITTMTKSTFRE